MRSRVAALPPLLRLGLAGAGIHLVLRLVTAVLLVRASAQQVPFPPWTDADPGYLDLGTLWDGYWYRQIAEGGYPATLPVDGTGTLQQNAWAFYPLFPFAARAVMELTGLGFPVVGSSLALLAGTAAAGVIAVVLGRRAPAPAALVATAVWSAFPASPTLQIAYTESFAVLLLALWLLALQRRRYGWLALLSLLVGVTRPVAVPLGAVLLLVLVMRWVRREEPRTLRAWRRPVLALAATGFAGVLWPLLAWLGTGERDAYTRTMATWRAAGEIVPFRPWLDMSRWVLRDSPDAEWLGPVALAGAVVTLLVLVLGPWARGLGWELRGWCLAYPAYLGAVLDPFTSIFRYLLPLFPLAAVVVGAGWRRPARTPVVLALGAVLVLLGVRGQWAWITDLLVFHPPSDYPP